MSWYRQIKTFYTISINMFFFIIWGTISSIFLSNKVDYRLYFISLATAFLLQFIMKKFESKNWPKLFAVLVGALLTLAVSRGMYFILNSIFIIFILYITDTIEHEDINYDAYKARGKSGLILILFLGALLPLLDISLSKSILKFYIMYLISNIIVMREARSYYYKIRNPRSLIVNVLISLSILGLSVDIISERLLGLIKYVMKIAGILINTVIDFIGLLLAKPLLFCISKLKELLTSGMDIIKIPESPSGDPKNIANQIPWEDTGSLLWLYTVTRIVVIIAILIAVFVIISRFVSVYGNKNTDLDEQREKIKRERTKKESFINRLIKNLIRPGDLRSQILNVYKKFEEKTFDKGIFKRHMTAKQLENITKAYMQDSEGLSGLTSIYNEAKFSKHELEEEKLKVIKEDFNKVKKQL
jgi:hypothetical protein